MIYINHLYNILTLEIKLLKIKLNFKLFKEIDNAF
jgi:hypothetical protein